MVSPPCILEKQHINQWTYTHVSTHQCASTCTRGSTCTRVFLIGPTPRGAESSCMPPCWYPFPDRRRPRIARRSLAPLSTVAFWCNRLLVQQPFGATAMASSHAFSVVQRARTGQLLDWMYIKQGDLWCKLCEKVWTEEHLQSAKHHRWYQWHVEEPKSHGPATNHTGRCNWFASTSCPRLYTWHRANSAIWRCPACSTGIYDTSLRQLN